MKRAQELFSFDRWSSASPFVATTWRTRSEPEPDESMMSVAVSHWEIVVTQQPGRGWVTVRGPETTATEATIPNDAEFFGIQFSLGTFMPGLHMRRLVDGSFDLPLVTRSSSPSRSSPPSFWLDGSAWEVPGPDNADVFVDRLVRAGLLVHDPVVPAALHDDVGSLSTRTVERRVARATGLTRGAIRQVQRAERAVELLSRGVPALDVVRQVGYADQSHLTRSLKRFVGQTPSQIGPTRPGR